MSCNPEVLQFTLSPQTNLLKIHCRRFLQSHSRIKLKSIHGGIEALSMLTGAARSTIALGMKEAAEAVSDPKAKPSAAGNNE
ncbi:MAG: hypothetical protein WCR99_11600, partial [Sphaerochaeta sp.]